MSFQILPQDQSSFGKLATGAAKGFAEQAPKEVENYRLSKSLNKLNEQSGKLNPLEFATKAYGSYGITPQMVASLGELARYQNQVGGYGNKSNNPNGESQDSRLQEREQFNQERKQNSQTGNKFRDIEFENNRTPKSVPDPQLGQPQIVNTNPTREEAQVAKPWTKQRFNNEVGNILAQHPGIDIDRARSIAKENEQRDLARPVAEREADEYKEKVRDAVENRFMNQLGTRLQKNKEGIFEDITGDNLIDMQEGLKKEITENPKESIDNLVNKWTKKGLELARTKKELDVLSNRGVVDQYFDNENTFNKLKTYQKIYADANNLNEFYNKLRSDFGMSDQGAALIAYPRSKSVSDFLKNYKPLKSLEGSAHAASQVIKNIDDDDSILAIARELQNKDLLFNQVQFFEYLNDNLNSLRLNDRQKREVAQGASKVHMNWDDFFILPSKEKK